MTRALILVALAACSRQPEPPPSPPPPPPPPHPVPAYPARAVIAVTSSLDTAGGCVRRSDGHVLCWGDVADATYAHPTEIAGITDALGVALSDRHGFAWNAHGDVYAWDTGPRATRLPAASPIVEVAAGPDAVCFRDRGGTVRCRSERADYDYEGTVELEAPTEMFIGGHEALAFTDHGTRVTGWSVMRPTETYDRRFDRPIAVAISAVMGDDVAAAILGDGHVERWTLTDVVEEEPPIPPLPAHLRAIALGHDELCVLGDHAACWSRLAKHPTVRVLPGLDDARILDVAMFGGCAVTATDRVRCWGPAALRGEPRSDVPTPVPGPADVTALAVTGRSVCAWHATGRVTCWGEPRVPTEDRARPAARLAPADEPHPPPRPSRTSWTGRWDGQVYECTKRSRQLVCRQSYLAMTDRDAYLIEGDVSHATGASLPVDWRVPDLCLARTSGVVDCTDVRGHDWTHVAIDHVVALAAGPAAARQPPSATLARGRTCALQASGTVACWSAEDHRPVAIDGITDAVELAGSADVACVRTKAGAVLCWGDQDLVGAGRGVSSDDPVEVPGVSL